MKKDFQTKYDNADGEIQEKIEGIFSEYGLIDQFEDDCNKAFDKLPTDIQKRVEKILFESERREYELKILVERNLTEEEANTFLDLLNKIKLTEKDFENYRDEMDNAAIPFEGGMMFIEALTGLKEL